MNNSSGLSERFRTFTERAEKPRPLVVEGKLSRMVGLTLESVGCVAAVGDRCDIRRPNGSAVPAEVVGFNADRLLLMPIGEVRGLGPGAPVVPVGRGGQMPFGPGLFGRVLNGQGTPLDGRGPLINTSVESVLRAPLNPMLRRPVNEPFDVGVGAINALLTLGEGQRIGLFAGSGVGKSMLLSMMTRFSNADVVVVALIGERGREVGDFISQTLGPGGLERAIVVAAPADDPPLMRLHGAELATSLAEAFRDEGKRVLLLMDSLTRYAQAQREVGLAVGEPPTTRGYPPSVFAKLPQLAERAGNGTDEGGGSITAVYTVLTEADEQVDPIGDAARAILDGHIVLSRELAERGHFPAIDIEASVSRALNAVVKPEQLQRIHRFRQSLATYRQHQDLISVGAYVRGTNPEVDRAIAQYPAFMNYLRQDYQSARTMEESLDGLARLFDVPVGDVE
ncbi:MAG: FliI/YscN family ATPase [Gammaproteobacteria bacterium]|nr:FliI/YscN family ATPase [Gammaproteobacteria bacterium]